MAIMSVEDARQLAEKLLASGSPAHVKVGQQTLRKIARAERFQQHRANERAKIAAIRAGESNAA